MFKQHKNCKQLVEGFTRTLLKTRRSAILFNLSNWTSAVTVMATCLKHCLKSNRHVHEKKFMCKVEDYDRTYDIPMFIFKIIGIRLNKNDTKFVRLFWNIYYWFEFVNLFVAVAAEILYMVVTKGGTFEDAVHIFVMMPCVGYVILGMVKCYKIVYHSDVYENLLNELRAMYPRGAVSEEEHRIATTSNTRLNYVIRGYYFCNIILLVTYMCRPYIAELKRYLGHEIPKDLLFFYYFPFDPYQPIVYEIVTVMQTWQGHIAVMFLQCGDMMFCILLSHIATQFDLLSLRIQRLVRVPTDSQLPASYPLGGELGKMYNNNKNLMDTFNEYEMDRKHFWELKEIIRRHQALIRLAGDMENLMSFSLLLNFSNSSIIICFCGFCSIIVEKVSDVVYKSFLVTALVQTWLLCWYGQRLLESSLAVSEALNKCGWYKTSKRNRSIIFIMMHRSQKAVRVTTYGFSVLCLASYTTIIKTAWSYFTLLLNVYRK